MQTGCWLQTHLCYSRKQSFIKHMVGNKSTGQFAMFDSWSQGRGSRCVCGDFIITCVTFVSISTPHCFINLLLFVSSICCISSVCLLRPPCCSGVTRSGHWSLGSRAENKDKCLCREVSVCWPFTSLLFLKPSHTW